MAAESRARTFSLLIIASAIWGFQPVCIKWLLDEWSPVTITAVRYFLFSAILFAIVWHREGRQLIPQGRTWVSLVLMGLGFMLNNVLQITGIGLTTVTNSTLISATSPANTAFLAAVFVRERLSVLSWAGIFISFLGTLTVISDGNLVRAGLCNGSERYYFNIVFPGCAFFFCRTQCCITNIFQTNGSACIL